MSVDTTGPFAARRLPESHRKRHALGLGVAVCVLVINAVPLDRPIAAWERNLFHAINALPSWLFVPVWVVMQAGNLLTVLGASALAFIAGRRRQALDVAVAGGSAWMLAKVVKELAGRARPADILGDVVLRGGAAEGNGYVSGHAAVAAALAAALTPYLSRRWKIVVWVTAALVGFGRIYVGAHLPLDVFGGLAMGWAIGSIVHVLLGEPRSRENKSSDTTA